ncbi:phage tail tube protein [Acetatifactor muris]|uniref:phage tail tube protein n=1 Tax=Acetatifactor muris TaxID=879566 RepID=UPI0023F58173|nr:phage tail tube protein [Acetatifactor muris]
MSQTMDAKDAVYGSLAECFITISGRRYNFMSLTEFESKWDVTIKEVPILGKVGAGHKPAGGKGTWSGKAHYNQSVFREMANHYQKTGEMVYFEIQVSNEDPTSSVGRQTVIHRNCLCDKFTLAKFQAGEELLDEDLSGTFDEWDLPEKFKELNGFATN